MLVSFFTQIIYQTILSVFFKYWALKRCQNFKTRPKNDEIFDTQNFWAQNFGRQYLLKYLLHKNYSIMYKKFGQLSFFRHAKQLCSSFTFCALTFWNCSKFAGPFSMILYRYTFKKRYIWPSSEIFRNLVFWYFISNVSRVTLVYTAWVCIGVHLHTSHNKTPYFTT